MQNLQQFSLVVLMLLCTVGSGRAQTWNPMDEDTQPFEDLEKNLARASSLLLLDDKCVVKAMVVPDFAGAAQYFPTVSQVRKLWASRVEKYGGTCSGTPIFDPLKPLNGGPAGACNPGAAVPNPDDRPGVLCAVDHANVHFLLVLDGNLAPVTIIGKPYSQALTPTEVPARFVARTAVTQGAPCSPTTPSPCYPPRKGVLVNINGQSICLCQ